MAKRTSRPQSSDEAPAAKPAKPRASRAKAPADVTPVPVTAADTPGAMNADTGASQAVSPPPVALGGREDNGATRASSMSSEPSDADIRMRAYHKFLHRDGGPGTDVDDWVRAEKELRKSDGDKRQLS